MIPHSRPDLGDQEAEAARAVVAGASVAQGVQVQHFEEEVAAFVGRRFGVATSSGTAALQITLQALGVGNRRVLMPSYVCSALVHATQAAGALPALADVDGSTGNLEHVPASAANCAAAILPHMFGRASTVAAELSTRLPVIEDLAMALGSRQVGMHGVAAVCSFYATKVITAAGEGGMVLTDDESLAQEIRALREYDGQAVDRQRWNYKLTDVAAAVGRVQLRRLPELLARRHDLARRYDEVISGPGLERLPCDGQQNNYRYVVNLQAASLSSVLDRFADHGVAARRPVPTGLHQALAVSEPFPGTCHMLTSALSVPLYPSLREDEVQRVLDAASAILPAHSPAEAH